MYPHQWLTDRGLAIYLKTNLFPQYWSWRRLNARVRSSTSKFSVDTSHPILVQSLSLSLSISSSLSLLSSQTLVSYIPPRVFSKDPFSLKNPRWCQDHRLYQKTQLRAFADSRKLNIRHRRHSLDCFQSVCSAKNAFLFGIFCFII